MGHVAVIWILKEVTGVLEKKTWGWKQGQVRGSVWCVTGGELCRCYAVCPEDGGRAHELISAGSLWTLRKARKWPLDGM